jgi:hypothetical protein
METGIKWTYSLVPGANIHYKGIRRVIKQERARDESISSLGVMDGEGMNYQAQWEAREWGEREESSPPYICQKCAQTRGLAPGSRILTSGLGFPGLYKGGCFPFLFPHSLSPLSLIHSSPLASLPPKSITMPTKSSSVSGDFVPPLL